ncbi:MAG: hypothetical protein ABIQ04_04150 [Candidatus Saccharimonadales bacterium]
MGLFQSKKQSKKKSPQDDAAALVSQAFDEEYREELRRQGHEYFEQIISENAISFKHDLDTTITQVGADLKEYMTKQLDATIAHINTEMTKQLDERLTEYDRITTDAQDLAVQSLNRNAQTLYNKYQQLSQTLQQSIASQEVMMIGVFEENKSRMTTTQNAQEVILQALKASAQVSQEQSKQLTTSLQKTIVDQQALLTKVFEENMTRVTATKEVQDTALQSLNSSAEALKEQYKQMSAMLENSVVSQESMLVTAFEDNMAQVIEHYLLGSLGDQYDIKAQLPSIIKQMETSKQAIMDDMKL